MSKRKTPTKQVPQASTEAVGGGKQESNTKVAQANATAKKASTGGRRGRPKKALVERVGDDIVYTGAGKKLLDETLTVVSNSSVSSPAPVQKIVDVDSRTITYAESVVKLGKAIEEFRDVVTETQKPEPSLYDRFVGWLTYKLYQITSPFRGY